MVHRVEGELIEQVDQVVRLQDEGAARGEGGVETSDEAGEIGNVREGVGRRDQGGAAPARQRSPTAESAPKKPW